MMVDRKEIIKRLEHCQRADKCGCFGCPYPETSLPGKCQSALMYDALQIIRKKQQGIVHCKDCEYRGDTDKCIVAYVAMKQNIEIFIIDNHGEWFCGDGKRRDDKQNDD